MYLVRGTREGRNVRQRTLTYLGPLAVLAFGIPKSVRTMAERRTGAKIDWNTINKRISEMPVEFDAFAASKRIDSLRNRMELRRTFSSRQPKVPSRSVSELLAQRAPGELEALTRLSELSFQSAFEKLGQYEYRLRD